ncbi:aminopeptidase P family protein [Neoehrlichia mikurensis]|uniref:Aminopeptidase P family protein n=1 Tax=Neoehrlichia mikurensis TaxID=89586 RepID=A0A9Q9F423_9RICK|nr:aminopeptidase P family protein [Neoehrlichia mikurensis]QXK91849.1 aminopeptidase P family protein [Neoehrlichia mikurensis]QXK93062.1 aminopeptidase P family protein [Neoehrlichia mikurensis]QXK93541.1 aminopeptidase P family protein [Neoehrlichia mikurensis]UTO55503.1 aminopeptidase P family protein [Neoehrlichia mikurensis]UTO56425.1 aminopeptidase P family protein [Neoehrlichia mikurensis]
MNDKLQNLLLLMDAYNVDVLLLHNTDEYQSEYVLPMKQRIKWLCGFTGSNAFLIITKHCRGYFFTDGRYILQAKMELDNNYYTIFNISDVTPLKWLEKNLHFGSVIGCEAQLFTLSQVKVYEKYSLKLINNILIDKLWNRSMDVSQRIINYSVKYSGEDSYSKCINVAENYCSREAMLITDIEVISWLLNIRNAAFIHNPAVFARAILYKDGKVDLFIDDITQIHVVDSYVNVLAMEKLDDTLKVLDNISVDASTIPMYLFNIIKDKDVFINAQDPCLLLKAEKNIVEIQGAIRAHVRDGVAVINLLYWLYDQIMHCNKITELDVESKVLEFRSRQELFQGESFATISGFAENAAVIHYKSSKKTNKVIEGNGLYLLDSGGQYLDGTTDITRTIAIGQPTDEQKYNFTLVLKGHIALAKAVFPMGISGGMLDILARQYLWNEGLDYQHGTGHGVGNFLSVHEGPQAISRGNNVVIKPGMILSNEPGYYKDGEYGIRLENLMYVEKHKNQFLRFQQLTCVPIDLNLVNVYMLSYDEICYLNYYHEFVYRVTSSYLCQNVRLWLKKLCQKL